MATAIRNVAITSFAMTENVSVSMDWIPVTEHVSILRRIPIIAAIVRRNAPMDSIAATVSVLRDAMVRYATVNASILPMIPSIAADVRMHAEPVSIAKTWIAPVPIRH